MAKAVIDLNYSDKTKEQYDNFIASLKKEGWKIESTFIDKRKDVGNYTYRTMIRRTVR